MLRDTTPVVTFLLDSMFPHLRYKYIGISGAALLEQALRQEDRRTLILPAFICPDLSVMGKIAGKQLIHIDVDPRTMHIVPGHLEDCLAQQDDSNVVLLVDHSFGYPWAYVPTLRAKHPKLLLVEDCVRALGAQIHGQPVGTYGDWVLLSMYKSIRGAEMGAVLMTRTPYRFSPGPKRRTTFRQLASTVGPFRLVYELQKRFRPNYPPTPTEISAIKWAPLHGLPDSGSQRRFLQELASFSSNASRRRETANNIAASLQELPNIEPIQIDARCQPAGTHLSFSVVGARTRDELLLSLHRKGVFLIRAWDVIPALLTSVQDAFPYGSTGSRFLAQHILHIPIDAFKTPRSQERLVRALKESSAESP